mmetsp:Transcript_33436/g.40499  ORF Transcript_33436/g.40499 Transcript_33436/m.40499 type:complete len:252 (-) Transcript_33436:310-1065(-)
MISQYLFHYYESSQQISAQDAINGPPSQYPLWNLKDCHQEEASFPIFSDGSIGDSSRKDIGKHSQIPTETSIDLSRTCNDRQKEIGAGFSNGETCVSDDISYEKEMMIESFQHAFSIDDVECNISRTPKRKNKGDVLNNLQGDDGNFEKDTTYIENMKRAKLRVGTGGNTLSSYSFPKQFTDIAPRKFHSPIPSRTPLSEEIANYITSEQQPKRFKFQPKIEAFSTRGAFSHQIPSNKSNLILLLPSLPDL